MMQADESELDSLYGGGPETQEPADETAKTVDQEEQEDLDTAIVPVKTLMRKSSEPPKKGDRFTFKVVEVYGDEVELVCEKKPGDAGYTEKSPEAEIDEMDLASVTG